MYFKQRSVIKQNLRGEKIPVVLRSYITECDASQGWNTAKEIKLSCEFMLYISIAISKSQYVWICMTV